MSSDIAVGSLGPWCDLSPTLPSLWCRRPVSCSSCALMTPALSHVTDSLLCVQQATKHRHHLRFDGCICGPKGYNLVLFQICSFAFCVFFMLEHISGFVFSFFECLAHGCFMVCVQVSAPSVVSIWFLSHSPADLFVLTSGPAPLRNYADLLTLDEGAWPQKGGQYWGLLQRQKHITKRF